MFSKEAKTAAKAKPKMWRKGILKSARLLTDDGEPMDLTGGSSTSDGLAGSGKSDVEKKEDEPPKEEDEPPINEVMYERFVKSNDVEYNRMLTSKLASLE